MNSFKPIYKANQLITGTGKMAIVTGWTPKEIIAKKIAKRNYAVVGQLYSPTRGINFLIRNLLANPHVRGITILNGTKEDKDAGGCQCLLDFFRYGVKKSTTETGRECWLIESPITGYIDQEIPIEALETLRHNFAVYDVEKIAEAIPYINKFNELFEFVEPYGEPATFPYLEPTAERKPGTIYGHRIEGKTVAQTWIKILNAVHSTGIVRPTGYGGQWQELIDLIAIVTDEPRDFYFPEPNYLPCDPQSIANYLPKILEDAPYRSEIKYTYGQRLRSWFGKDQVEQVIQKLIVERDAASAVMNLWDSGSGNPESFYWSEYDHTPHPGTERGNRDAGDSDHDHSGSPCLNHIWVRIIDDTLSMTATLRSNDMFGAWPSNTMGLRALQYHILDQINDRSDYNLIAGPLITVSQSAHIYDHCWDNIDRLISNQYEKIASDQIKEYDDPVGNFLVEFIAPEIVVTRLTPTGEVVEKFTGYNPLKLIREIVIAIPTISPAHAAYLAIEIEKAKSLKTDYTQN